MAGILPVMADDLRDHLRLSVIGRVRHSRAMLIAGSKTVDVRSIRFLVFSQSVPKIAIAPLFVVVVGFGISQG